MADFFPPCIAILFFSITGHAQNVFEQYGFDKTPLTLSNGVYDEFFDNAGVVQIGTVLFNTKTNKVVGFVADDSVPEASVPEVSSRWLSPDPLAQMYPEFSPYNFCQNNPIIRIDSTGASDTDFRDKNGKFIKHVEDGSNAVFQQTGTGTNLHYKFKEYDKKQGGKNEVNLTSAIQEQQNLNMNNSALQQNAQGNNETHCNESTQNILATVSSAYDNVGIMEKGTANDMLGSNGFANNPNYEKASYKEAETNAANGGLSIIGVVENPHGHVLTFSVGDNIEKGLVANIGPTKYTGFVPLNRAINKDKAKVYYILK